MSAAGGGLAAGAQLAGSAMDMQTQEGWQQLSAAQQQFLMQQLAKIQGIATPQFNTNLPPPEQLALQHLMAPQKAQATNVSIDPHDRAMQMAALQKLQGVTSGAADSELNAANYNAMNNAAQQERGQTQGILANLSARGTLGSGQELAARMQAAQNGANNSQAGMMEAAANNNKAKLGAQNSLLQGLSGLRGQDTGLASENANINNQFSMHNTDALNATNNANTGITNQQSTYNTGQNNAYQQALLQLQNSAAQQKYQDQLGQAQAAAGEANTISNNAMSAGGTNLALGANAASGAIGAAGTLGNSLVGTGQGSGYQNVSSGSVPDFKLTDPTSNFGAQTTSTGSAGGSSSKDPWYQLKDPNE
jgi:hypothetical protein